MKTLLNMIGTLLILGVLLFQGILIIVIAIGIALLHPRKVNKIWKNIFQETTESNSIH
jgi:hypothetical protein